MGHRKKTLQAIVNDFLHRYKLSYREAGKKLNISSMTVKIMLTGEDPVTGNPIDIKPKTLKKIAAGFEKIGYPVTYEDLMIACGYIQTVPGDDPLLLELREIIEAMDKVSSREFLEDMVLLAKLKRERLKKK